MAIEFRAGGRKVSLDQFFEHIRDEMLETGLTAALELIHGKAAAIVDPETGIHPLVAARRTGGGRVILKTTASEKYKSILNKRLGNDGGHVTVADLSSPAKLTRRAYLAHASENAHTAEWMARGLMSRGIDVWYSEWEIGGGDSLKRKMEDGLEGCTHFVVLLSSESLPKAWVNEEIDAGFLRQVEGQCKFLGLRYGTAVADLSIFLRTRHCPEFSANEEGLDTLAAAIFDVSRKPALGERPGYVQDEPPGKEGWSLSALRLAKHMCLSSELGNGLDTEYTVSELATELEMDPVDVEIALLDLHESGLLDEQPMMDESTYTPKASLYYEFDDYALGTNPTEDAKAAARYMASTGDESFTSLQVAQALGWPPRRLNPAIAYLVDTRLVEALDTYGGEYHPMDISTGPRLKRFVRDNP